MQKISPNELRAELLMLSKYSHHLNLDENQPFERWVDIVDRGIRHQQYIWQQEIGRNLNNKELSELHELRQGQLEKKIALAGRTYNLGGLPISKSRPETQFNCWYDSLKTVHDAVDMFYLLLCGGGVTSVLERGISGFQRPVELEVVRTQRTDKGGQQYNVETFKDGVWTIKVGDSAEGWAKFLGKLLAHIYPAKKLIVDFSELRPSGIVLSQFRWISNGDEALSDVVFKSVKIMNDNIGRSLSLINILDIATLFGGTLATRRSAQMMVMNSHDPEVDDFIQAKSKVNLIDSPNRYNSNNTIKCYKKPNMKWVEMLLEYGIDNDAPTIMNVEAAKNRYEGCEGVNPCGEALFPNCNLGEMNATNLTSISEAKRLGFLLARALYRQTCPPFSDGILQKHWDRNLKTTRQIGVGLTNIVPANLRAAPLKEIYRSVVIGGGSMAHELGTPVPQGNTVVKPSGTMTKVLGGGAEGSHHPLGKYIFNNINFRNDDPLLDTLRMSGYKIINHPSKQDSVLVTFPVINQNYAYKFKDIGNGVMIDAESVIDQLNRYLFLLRNWADQNVSMTVLYRKDEIPAIVKWLDIHWDEYISVAFMKRDGDTEYAENKEKFGYMPQEPVNKSDFYECMNSIQPIDIGKLYNNSISADTEECSGGVCPVN